MGTRRSPGRRAPLDRLGTARVVSASVAREVVHELAVLLERLLVEDLGEEVGRVLGDGHVRARRSRRRGRGARAS